MVSLSVRSMSRPATLLVDVVRKGTSPPALYQREVVEGTQEAGFGAVLLAGGVTDFGCLVDVLQEGAGTVDARIQGDPQTAEVRGTGVGVVAGDGTAGRRVASAAEVGKVVAGYQIHVGVSVIVLRCQRGIDGSQERGGFRLVVEVDLGGQFGRFLVQKITGTHGQCRKEE